MGSICEKVYDQILMIVIFSFTGAENVQLSAVIHGSTHQSNIRGRQGLHEQNKHPPQHPVATTAAISQTATQLTTPHKIPTQPVATAPQQGHTPSHCNVPTAKLRYRGNQLPTTQELALYALLLSAFESASDAFISHATANKCHIHVSLAMSRLFPKDAVVTTTSINNYFMHSHCRTRRNQLGKVKNSFRWNFFKTQVDMISSACAPELASLLMFLPAMKSSMTSHVVSRKQPRKPVHCWTVVDNHPLHPTEVCAACGMKSVGSYQHGA